jgi:hypothetical protein
MISVSGGVSLEAAVRTAVLVDDVRRLPEIARIRVVGTGEGSNADNAGNALLRG